MKLIDFPEAKAIGATIADVKARLAKVGLFETLHLIETAERRFGFEVDEHLMEHAREEMARSAKEEAA